MHSSTSTPATPPHNAPATPVAERDHGGQGGHATDATALALATLLGLSQRSRRAQTAAELRFIAVNETHGLVPYRQAALWQADGGVQALSGVTAPEANGPFVQWLSRVAQTLQRQSPVAPMRCTAAVLAAVAADDGSVVPDAADAAEWHDWLPHHALWLPHGTGQPGALAWLVAREAPFSDADIELLVEWQDHWCHALAARQQSSGLPAWLRWMAPGQPTQMAAAAAEGAAGNRQHPARLLWRDRRMMAAVALVAVACIPVRLTVLAPGELVAAHPSVIRAPLDGTVDSFFVEPNASVKAGDKLFQLDLTTLHSRLEVALQALSTAEAEYRQQAQLAVFDGKSKANLAQLEGRIAERRTEAAYLREQLARAQVTAPRDGVALVDDPTEWIGKPVAVGERVMSVADAHDVEVEAWLSHADAIELPDQAPVQLYLNARPLSPVTATLRYAAHEAVLRPDGSYAYRVRASLPEGHSDSRVGLKGTAKISGERVPAVYWVLRRPIAFLRQAVGL